MSGRNFNDVSQKDPRIELTEANSHMHFRGVTQYPTYAFQLADTLNIVYIILMPYEVGYCKCYCYVLLLCYCYNYPHVEDIAQMNTWIPSPLLSIWIWTIGLPRNKNLSLKLEILLARTCSFRLYDISYT